MSGGGHSTTTQQAQFPPELSPLYSNTTSQAVNFQNAAPLTPFTTAHPMQITPLSSGERRAISEAPSLYDLARQRVTGANIQSSPSFQAANQAYETAIQPGIENTASLAGLGRSTALTNAMAQARAQYLQPTIEGELAREERGIERGYNQQQGAIQAGLQTGGLERGITQAQNSADYQDYLRRQALAEEGLFTPLGLLVPSSIGQQSRTSGSQGLFK